MALLELNDYRIVIVTNEKIHLYQVVRPLETASMRLLLVLINKLNYLNKVTYAHGKPRARISWRQRVRTIRLQLRLTIMVK